MQKDRGSLEVGKVVDLSIWDIEHPDYLSCLLGANHWVGVIKRGHPVYEAKSRQAWVSPRKGAA
nr:MULTISPECIES: hypothetical protein [unclassified Bradyrhizobium]